ncbi:AraC family transcriptional regulator ligand-binding domain-containing protein [Paucibacter sediminis]|uniref:AraC family transcriptional regulator ligand-binding domain-containing protein n=1 Tax=Paucibacter sediminis TaxID=3019553 RepID=A0AA95NFV6_9BURK|nr:AraC family transcriptional regulator [Paucibacter sp. S2-9]WIT11564.1 AraC family transcriptional regulator ligand-binding domain-containing protein [Paucibacter sp. S2-9]
MSATPPPSRPAPAQPRRVPVRYFVLLLDLLRSQGTDVAQLLRMAGVEAERLTQRGATLLPSEIEAFVSSARQLTGRTDLGLEMGRLIKMNSHELLGFGMLSCRNWGEAMQLVARHYHLMTETFSLRYRRIGGGVGEAVYTPLTAMPLETLRFYYEVLAVAHQNQVHLMLGGQEPAYDIYLSMPPPPHAQRYLALGPARFHFDAQALPGVRVLMGADLLDHALAMADANVVREVDERCTALGQRPPAGETGWGDYVRMLLRETPGRLVTLEDLAQRIHVSPRTIDRYLKKEKLQFRSLAERVRFELACELLGEPGATVTQVALQLGFSDSANFSRSFRRVIGITPSEYQQRPRTAATPSA